MKQGRSVLHSMKNRYEKLPEDANIYASEYQLYLLDKKELQKKLKERIEEGPDL